MSNRLLKMLRLVNWQKVLGFMLCAIGISLFPPAERTVLAGTIFLVLGVLMFILLGE
jgi:hypothetical protein